MLKALSDWFRPLFILHQHPVFAISPQAPLWCLVLRAEWDLFPRCCSLTPPLLRLVHTHIFRSWCHRAIRSLNPSPFAFSPPQHNQHLLRPPLPFSQRSHSANRSWAAAGWAPKWSRASITVSSLHSLNSQSKEISKWMNKLKVKHNKIKT